MNESPRGTNSPPPNSADSNTQATAPKRHASYYLQDDPMAIFLVENQLFKIHRHFLSEGSKVFCDMFTCPVGEGTGPEGMADERPIPLPGVTVEEFEALLNYLYQSPHLKSECSKEQRLQISLNLLSISHRFDFEKIFEYVLGDLKSIMKDVPPLDILFIGKEYDLEEWLLSGLEALLDRATPLTVREVEDLGPEVVVRYMCAREAMHKAQFLEELKRARPARVPLFGPLDVAPKAPRSTRSFVEEFFKE